MAHLKVNEPTPKWVIIETKVANTSVRKCHHRARMFVAYIIHDQGKGLVDLKTSEVYPCAFNNKWFGTEAKANKYLAEYFKTEMVAMEEMMETINTFANKNPELMV